MLFRAKGNIYDNQMAQSVIDFIESKKSNSHISFYNLLDCLLKKYGLNITEDFKTDVISISGDNGYHVIATLYYVLKELEHNRIIMMIKNNNGEQYRYKITDNHNGTSNYIHLTEELKKFLEDNKQTNIWLSPNFEWFKQHGYKTRELVEAKKQTNYAWGTLVFALLTFFVSVLTSIFQIKGGCVCVKILCLSIIMIVGILLVQYGCKVFQCEHHEEEI